MTRLLLTIGCLALGLTSGVLAEDGKPSALHVTSQAFAEGGKIPSKYTCDGRDVSPPLQWDGVPGSAKTLALICDDPDAPAGTWVHWVMYNLPARTASLKENITKGPALINNWRQGKNDFDKFGYNGPCPPGGKAHRYFFKVYALDAEILAGVDFKKADLVKAMEGHIVGEGSLMGLYQRN